MSTSKRFDQIAIVCIVIALVIAILFSLLYVPVSTNSTVTTLRKSDVLRTTSLITFSEDSTTIQGSGATLQDDTVQIVAGGTYHFQGSCSNGQIYVNVEDTEQVILVLEGVSLSNENAAPIYVENSGSCYLYLMDDTQNTISSGVSTNEKTSSAEGGAITFKDDAVILGTGSLEVHGYINNGIHCSNNLYIEDGIFVIDAVNKGIRGTDSLTIDGGSITITSCYEGFEGEHITVNDGEVSIIASDDGMNANGGSNNFGNFDFGNMGHGNDKMGDFSENLGDFSEIPDDFDMSSMPTPPEIPDDFSSENGTTTPPEMPSNSMGDMASSTDMMSPGFSMDSSEMPQPSEDFSDFGTDSSLSQFEENPFNAEDELFSSSNQQDDGEIPSIIINGGTIQVTAGGDGLDSNGDLIVNGGTLIVDGPSGGADSALDVGSENGGQLLTNGGIVLALGNSAMAELPEDGSEQCAFSVSATFSQGQLISIYDSDENLLISYTAQHGGDIVIFSCDSLEVGSSYTLCVDDTQYNVTQDSTVSGSITSSIMGGGGMFGGIFGNHSDKQDADFDPSDFGDETSTSRKEPPSGDRMTPIGMSDGSSSKKESVS